MLADWAFLTEPLWTVVKWSIYVLLIGGAVGALILARRCLQRWLPARRGIVVGLEDLSAAVGERNLASHVLSRQLLTELQGLASPVSKPDADIDETADLDRSVLANLNLGLAGDGVQQLDALVEGEPSLSIGPVSFSLRQIAYLVASFFRRASEFELTGSLTPHGARTVIAAERANATGKRLNRWYAVRSGEDAAPRLVGDLAMQIVVDLGCSTATSSWQSFRDYRIGLAALEQSAEQGQDGLSQLKTARVALLRSLERDPLNPLARFYLATVARKLGDNEGAVNQYELLEQLIHRSADSKSSAFFKDHPEFRPIVRYNLAVALLQLPRPDHRRALRILNGIEEQLARRTDVPPFTGVTRYRFEILVRSAIAAALAFRVKRMVRDSGKLDAEGLAKRDARIREIVRQIKRAVHAVEPLTADALTSPVAYGSAVATAENALGTALLRSSHPAEAVAAFRRAVTIHPNFVEAWLNLAEALHGSAGKLEWQREAEAALLEALRLDPTNARGEYLLARLLLHPSVARRTEAIQHLDGAGAYPPALFLRAELLERENRLPEAIALLDQAIARAPAADYGMLRYVQDVLALSRASEVDVDVDVDVELLRNARERAQRLKERGVADRFRRRGAELLDEVDAKLAAMKGHRSNDAR